MIDAVTFYDANLNLLLSSFMVSTSLRYGHTESSSVGYAAFAMVLGFDRRAEAYRFGKLAYDLDERLGSKINEVKIATFVAGTLNPWNKPYKSGLAHLDGAARAGAENGDFLWASYSLFNLVWLLFMAGEPLADLNYESENRLALVRAMKADDTACSIVVLQRCISNLRGITADSSTYDGDGGGEAAFEEIMDRERIPTFVCMRNIWKMQVRFVLGHHDAALAASAKAKATLWAVYRLGILPEFHYYDALLRAALYRDVSPSQQEEYMATLVAHEKALRTWAEGCPENFAAKHALVSAEIARIGGREMAAGRSYEQAVRLARQYGLVQNEAIANETAARFYRAQGLDSIATMYLREARACYARWGADGKVKQLELQSPHLFEPSPVAATTAQGTPVATPGIHAEQLDLLTVIKASQAISREIVLGDLLETLMRVVLESAGAQTASLMLARGGELTLAAVASVDQHGVSVRRREGEALSSSELPLSILNYVRRSRKQVLLENANQPNPFAADESLVQRQPKSILCLPILRQAELIGILYLENNLVTNAFTPDRLAVLELLAGQAAISLEIASLIETEQRAREAMARSESRFRRIFESNMIGLIFGDLTGAIKQANDYMLDMLGYTRDDLDSGGLRWTEMTPPEWRAASANAVAELRSSGVCRPFEKEYIRKDGSRVPALLGSSILPGTHDEMLTFVLDITDRKRAEASLRRSEEHLRQAQKMDAIGNLAGGIAHDFNNLLSVILSYSGMLARRMSPDDPRRAQLEEIEGAGKRAAELTHQLLAFGRKQVLQPTVVNLSEILTGVEPMLRRLIGEDIELIVRAAPTLGEVKADRGQIEQIVMNLTVNGRDAMPQGGRLTLETANADLDDAYAAEHAGVVAGPHVMLAVTDTGIGMDEATQARMFEPFFTTKEKGKGTGLGLATVFGIVQQSGGNVSVSSEPGKGATFKIHFPRTDAVAAGVHESVAPEPAPMVGTETILLVEDDVRVRALARTILQGCGYLVVEARSGGDALRVCEEHPAIIHLLLTDVIMPRMSGPQLAERLRASHPEMKVLFMSGYTDDSIVHRGVLKPGVAFLQKPITPETLTRKVREALDAARTDPSHI
jgi:PAS domain S-box-containing protein